MGTQNEWHTVRFQFGSVLDGGTSPVGIDQMAVTLRLKRGKGRGSA